MEQNSRIPYDVIQKAMAADEEALRQVIDHFGWYINRYATIFATDEYGDPVCYVDDEIKDRIVTKLVLQITQKFNPDSLKDAEIYIDK